MPDRKQKLSKKPFLVLALLVIASLACYSDSPLWVFGVTDVPPSMTFLPTPDPVHPARFEKSDLALAPQPTTPEEAFFFVTKLPGELLAGVRNASGSCEYGSSLEILYVGHQYEEFSGTLYLDDVTATTVAAEGQEASTETLFDFESDSPTWTLADTLPSSDELSRQNNVNFSALLLPPAEGEEPADVSNATYVLGVRGTYAGDERTSGAYVTFDSGIDWSNYAAVSARVFVPQSATEFAARLYVKSGAGATEVISDNLPLTAGAWNDITFDLSQIEDRSSISEFGVQFDPNPNRTYYLVTCAGTVGWTNENRMAGPIQFVRGQSALTASVDSNNNPIAEGQPFLVYTDSEPPAFNVAIAQKRNCAVGEIVDIIDISAVKSLAGIDQIWYQVRCSESAPETFGWVEEFRLSGPLLFPRSGGLGIVADDSGGVNLLAEAGPESESNASVGTCDVNQLINTIEFTSLPGLVEGTFIPYYKVQCGDIAGWTTQSALVEAPYPPDTIVMVIGQIADPTATIVTYGPAPVTDEPGPAFEGNILGECPSGTVVRLGRAETSVGLVFYEITCNELTGWLEGRFLPNAVSYELNIPAWFIEPSITGRKVAELGYSLLERPDIAGNKVGQCELFTQATITNNTFEKKALTGAGRSPFRVYYEVTCLSIERTEITGWVEQDSIVTALTTRNPNRLIGG